MSDLTTSDVAQTTPSAPEGATQLSKINAYLNDDNKWQADLEYRDAEGNKISGETRTFDEFSQLTAWVAGTEVEVKQNQDQGSEDKAPDPETK